MTKRVNDRNTKSEILAAYEELKKEKSALQSQFNKLSNGQSKNGSATVETIQFMNGNGSKQPKIQQTIEGLMILQSGFGASASELSEQLTQEATTLQSLQESVESELQQLNALYDLEEVNDETLEQIIQEYEASSKTFETELTERRETLEQQAKDQQKEWKKEQEDYQRQLQERNENHQKTRQRDQENYHYTLQLQRERDIEDYEQSQQQLYQQLEERRQEQEKQWKEREEAITQREKEAAEIKAKVEAFPGQKEAAVQKGKEIGRNIGYSQAKIKADLLAKEMEGQKQFYQLQIQSLSETITTQEARLQSLVKQLDSAQKQVQDLAVKAIEGTSNINSFQAVKEIALEQAKTQPKGK